MGATRTSAMIALILAGAAFLSLSMGYTGLPRALADFIGELNLSKFQLLMALLVFYVILGCFLDGISSVVLTMAVVEPMIREAGIDVIWFGIFVVVAVEMAQITPPIGFNLFVLQGMTQSWDGLYRKGGAADVFDHGADGVCADRGARTGHLATRYDACVAGRWVTITDQAVSNDMTAHSRYYSGDPHSAHSLPIRVIVNTSYSASITVRSRGI